MQINGTAFHHYSELGKGLRVEETQDAQPQRTSANISARMEGDTVSISEEGRSMAVAQAQGQTAAAAGSEEDSSSMQDQLIERIRKQIQKLQEEIKALQNDMTLSDEEKAKQLQMKQSELTQLQTQLQKAQEEQLKAQGLSLGGGTRAQGFGNSLSK